MFKSLLCLGSLVIATVPLSAPVLAHQESNHSSVDGPLPLPENGPLPVSRPDTTFGLPEIGPVPPSRPTTTVQESKATPLTFESLFLKKSELIPTSDDLLTLIANGFGCRFASLAADSMECPLDSGPENTYVTGTPRGGFLDSGLEMVRVKHRLTLERLEISLSAPLKGVQFQEPHAWKDRYGSQNLEVQFSVEGETYRLNFIYYDFGREV